MNEIKVLIVDDQRLVREGIASLLDIQDGINIIGTAENGRNGVQMAMELHPEIILMDIRMPVQAGAVGYLMKDIPADDLARAIQQAYHDVFQMTGSVMGALIGTINKAGKSESELPGIPEAQQQMINQLSEREKEVFKAIGRGDTNSEIAEELFLSEGTIKNYVSAIFNALGLRDRVQAALIASRWEKSQEEEKG